MLKWFYPLKINTADGQASQLLTAESGSDNKNLISSLLAQANDFWNGAIGRFESNTDTVALRGIYFHIKDFVASTDKLVLAQELPATPSTGYNEDKFRLFFGGNCRTSHEIPGLDIDQPTNVTGVTLNRAGHENGAGSGTLAFSNAATTLTWQAPSDSNPGAAVDVSAGGTFILYSEDENKWIGVTVIPGSLPGADQTDTLTLAVPDGEVLPDMEGYETTMVGGKTRYHLVVVQNSDPSNIMYAMRAFVAPDTKGTATNTTSTLGVVAGTLTVSDASDWPLRSFWVYNSTKDDVRYVTHRNGNTLYCLAAGAGLRGLTAQAWGSGDAVEVYPEIDIGLDPPTGNQFQNPANEVTAPSGVTFSAPEDYANGLEIGDQEPDELMGIWIRETVLQGAYSREDFTSKVSCQWT